MEEEAVRESAFNDDRAHDLVESVPLLLPARPRRLFFNQTSYQHKLRLESRCSIEQTVTLLRNKLSVDELGWFTEHPQFRHIFHMHCDNTRKFTGMWILLLRTTDIMERNKCWFIVNGVPIHYSIKEHALISGLHYHELPTDYENQSGSTDFSDRLFNGEKINMATVLAKLESVSDAGDDRLKMALLYFLGTVIQGKKKSKHTLVRPFLSKMVDNLVLFACSTSS